MGRLTEIFDTMRNGFSEPESYHWIEPKDEETRDILKRMREAKPEQPTLFDDDEIVY